MRGSIRARATLNPGTNTPLQLSRPVEHMSYMSAVGACSAMHRKNRLQDSGQYSSRASCLKQIMTAGLHWPNPAHGPLPEAPYGPTQAQLHIQRRTRHRNAEADDSAGVAVSIPIEAHQKLGPLREG